MNINNVNSQSFSGYKYHATTTVVKSWYNYYLGALPKSKRNYVAKLIEKQKSNPHDIILNYKGDDKSVQNFATIDGTEIVKKEYESMKSFFSRLAKFADKRKNKEIITEDTKLLPFELDVIK